MEQLNKAQHAAAESLYKNAQSAASGGGGSSAGGGGGESGGGAPHGGTAEGDGSGKKDDVIDAEVVDEK